LSAHVDTNMMLGSEGVVRELLDQTAWAFKNLLFPAFCRRCDARILTEENLYYCPRCWSEIRLIERPYCSVCGKPHDKAAGFTERDNFPCADCGTIKRRPYGRMYAATVYDGLVQEAITLFKYGSRELLVGPLASLMIEFAEREVDFGQYDAVVPVPLHRVRQRERGFNQAEKLARCLTERFSQLAVENGLLRIRETPQQTRLSSAERRRNIKGAFALAQEVDCRGKTILLVDDVITTGATAEECARTLRRGGTKTVDVLAVARAITARDNY
jgi:ComF family protein